MKKLILSLLFSAAAASGFAQALNGGFETWGQVASEPTEPTGWITANLFASPLLTLPNPNPNPTSAFISTTPNIYMGTKSLRLVTVVLLMNPDPGNIPDTIGACITGSVQLALPSFDMRDRIPFTGRPAFLNFAAQYTPNGVDTASVYMELTKWNGVSEDLIQDVWVPIISGPGWNNYSIPLSSTYNLSTIPDSLSIGITSSSYYAPQPGSQLYIDNVSFSGWVGTNEEIQEIPVMVYPNPATESLTIDAGALKADLSAIEIYDMNGKLVMEQRIQNAMSLTMDVRSLPAGVYSFVLRGVQGIGMGDGKFTITK